MFKTLGWTCGIILLLGAVAAAAGASPVNGHCGIASGEALLTAPVRGFCSTGTPAPVTGKGPWSWICAGTEGGAATQCTAPLLPDPANGRCGPADGAAFSRAPVTNLCDTGTPGAIKGTGPWSWSCMGGGLTTNDGLWTFSGRVHQGEYLVMLNGQQAGNGRHGIRLEVDRGQLYLGTKAGAWVKWSAEKRDFIPAESGPPAGPGNPVLLSGQGNNAGASEQCSSLRQPAPLNGACGAANGMNASAAPTDKLCRTGAASYLAGAGPWSWSCAGADGGTAAACHTGPSHCIGTAIPPRGAVVHAPSLAQPRSPNDVVGVMVQNLDPAAATNGRPYTFGQVFKPGHVRPGDRLVARISNGDSPVQMDVKTLWPDGSVRIAAITLNADVCPGAQVQAMLAKGAAQQAGAPVDLSAAAFDLAVTLTFAGGDGAGPVSADLGKALQAALRGKPDYWLRGPLATQARVYLPLSALQPARKGSMRLVADVTAFADGGVEADVQFANDIAMSPFGGTVSYTPSIRLNGVAYREARLTHYQYQTWHAVLRSNAVPDVNVQHDPAYLEATGAIQAYNLEPGVNAGAFSTMTKDMAEGRSSGWAPLTGGAANSTGAAAGIIMGMGMTGDRADIGPLTWGQSVWAVTQDAIAANYALKQADYVSGSVPWHFFDPRTGAYLSIFDYPHIWNDYRCGSDGVICLTQPVSPQSGWQPDSAHMPTLNYFPYIMTARRYYLDQLNAQVTGSLVTTWSFNRLDPVCAPAGYSACPDLGLVVWGLQQRSTGWLLREIYHAVFANPDEGSSSMKAHMAAIRDNNDAALVRFVTGNGLLTKQGQPHGYFHNGGIRVPTWMNDYIESSLILAARQGDTAIAKIVLPWTINWQAGRFLNAANGFNPYNGIQYHMVTDRPDGVQYQTWRELQAANIAAGEAGPNDQTTWHPGAMTDYVQDACMVLAGIIDVTGSADARRALAWLKTSSNTYCDPHNPRSHLMDDPRRSIIPSR